MSRKPGKRFFPGFPVFACGVSALKRTVLVTFLLQGAFLLLAASGFASAGGPAGGPGDLGRVLPLWTMIPFIGILLSIALGPLWIPHIWHRHYGKIAAFWALVFAVPFVVAFRGAAVQEILHICLVDYIPFVILLWGLFTIAGGIGISGAFKGTPAANLLLLLTGTVLASWIGTTGAAMVMIRPLLRANRERLRKAHVVCFFIILVANIGGALTPLGDPPLFLGFLHGVPFFWVTRAVLPPMIFTSAALLAIFYLIDRYHFRKETPGNGRETPQKATLKIEGLQNLFFLAGVVAMVLLSGYWSPGGLNVLGIQLPYQNLLRDAAIVVMGLLSLRFTPSRIRQENDFGWAPIIEVAKLFAGIFLTIIPALAILRAGSMGAMAPLLALVDSPVRYFWTGGLLSSFLDNAPTYLAFYNMALAQTGLTEAMVPGALDAAAATASPVFIGYLKALSVGSVFMGANTYIGNAPNFMIKSIAEEAGVAMPGFFGYMWRYSLLVLVPVFILVSLLFF